MTPSASVQARAQAHLALTPGIQLALRLLQIPTLELRDLIQQELLTNPLLEIEEEDGPSLEDEGNQDASGQDAGGAEGLPGGSDEAEPEPPDWVDLLPGEEETGSGRGQGRSGEDLLDWTPAAGPSLFESLLSQLRLAETDPRVLSVAEFLAGCLDDRGYLGCSLEEAAQAFGAARDLMEKALARVQDLEPPGVGARDLRECLLLQLRARGRKGSLAWRILEEHFPSLAARRQVELGRALKVPAAEVEEAVDEIRLLRPHPGRLVAGDEVRYIYPDLIVERVDGGYEVYPNERALPRLRLSRWCRRLLAGEGEDAAVREFARDRLRSARWLVQALDRRRATMLRVAEGIVAEQEEFFEHGVEKLRPLTLQQVASRLALHESTVARVVRHKHVQTPRGIFPLRFFFSSRLGTRSGREASGRAVRERIRALIEEEDRGRPLSDEDLARILQREGVRIARRTVAKYRESMKIEHARLRRRRAG